MAAANTGQLSVSLPPMTAIPDDSQPSIHDDGLDLAQMSPSPESRQSFLLDGTLTSYTVAEKNIRRCLNHKRTVQILVYQRPEMAWRFVQARERNEGRRIRVDTFIEQYFAARELVNRLKERFGRDIVVDVLLKEYDGSNQVYRGNVDRIDNHISEKYSRAQLETELTTP